MDLLLFKNKKMNYFRLVIDAEESSLDNVTSRLLILSNSMDSHKCEDSDSKNLLLSIEARNVTLKENILQSEDRNIIGKVTGNMMTY